MSTLLALELALCCSNVTYRQPIFKAAAGFILARIHARENWAGLITSLVLLSGEN